MKNLNQNMLVQSAMKRHYGMISATSVYVHSHLLCSKVNLGKSLFKRLFIISYLVMIFRLLYTCINVLLLSCTCLYKTMKRTPTFSVVVGVAPAPLT